MVYELSTMVCLYKKQAPIEIGAAFYIMHMRKNKVDATKLILWLYTKMSKQDERNHFSSNGKYCHYTQLNSVHQSMI